MNNVQRWFCICVGVVVLISLFGYVLAYDVNRDDRVASCIIEQGSGSGVRDYCKAYVRMGRDLKEPVEGLGK